MVLYKLPKFYNAFATGSATMIFVHSRIPRVYPRGGGILELSNLRVYYNYITLHYANYSTLHYNYNYNANDSDNKNHHHYYCYYYYYDY